MTPKLEALARRAVACPRWRWMPGMRVVPILADDTIEPVSGTIVADRGFLLVYWPDVGLRWQGAKEHLLPDLADPATAGCLLAMLVAVDPGAGWGVSCGPDVGWRATSCDHDLSGATCGEALARALGVERSAGGGA